MIDRPSPNFSKRVHGLINAIVIHATASESVEVTLEWFESIDSRVSSHYVIDKNGEVYKCVAEEFKAWHAGESVLWLEKNVNEFSIGIELVNLNNDIDEYPPEQLSSLIGLCKEICSRHNQIWLNRIIGHEHISPSRKTDPGGQFPWREFLIALGGHLA